MQEPNLHRRVPSFSLPRNRKEEQDPSKSGKHAKRYSSKPISYSIDSKHLRQSQSHDRHILRRSKDGEIFRNMSSSDERDDSSNIIRWSSVHQNI
jgi:hypothetical protein